MINIFLTSLLILTIVILYIGITTAGKNLYRLLILVPITLIICVSMFFTIKEIQSLPIDGMPVGEFQPLKHTTDGKIIFLWAIEDESEFPRTWRFPYSDEAAKKLSEAEHKEGQGIRTLMKVKPSNQDTGGTITILGSPRSKEQDRTNRKDYEG